MANDGEGEGPEDDAGNSEDPEGQAGEEALNGGDGESTEGGGEDGVADPCEELGRSRRRRSGRSGA